MVYRFFLYNLKYPGNADRIGKNLETNFLRDPADGREAAKQLVSFDTEAVVARLSGMLGGNAIVLVNHHPKGMVQTSYIRVVTSYVKADEVYHKIMAAACEFNLAYQRFTYRMEYMMKVGKEKGYDLISFMGP